MIPVVILMGVYCPLPTGLMGLILGRSSTTLRGLKVLPRIVDSDFEGEIKIMVEPPRETFVIHVGQ